MNAAAISMGTKIPNKSRLTSEVSLVGDMKKLDMGLSVKIVVEGIKGVERDLLQKIVDRAHEVSFGVSRVGIRADRAVGLSLFPSDEGKHSRRDPDQIGEDSRRTGESKDKTCDERKRSKAMEKLVLKRRERQM